VDVEFHYYIIHYLSREAGFSPEEAQIIAFSSEFVDSNIISYTIETERGHFKLHPTQNYGFWDESFPREAYIPFHFFPGDPEFSGLKRKDGKKNIFSCSPHSRNVKELLIRGLKTRNLYRVGIALHTYADCYAHQNFSGIMEDWNQIDEASLIPAIGHAQALGFPDNLGGVWNDPRLSEDGGRVLNRRRFLKAARMIYRYLCTYNKRSFDDEDLVLMKLEEFWGPDGREKEKQERIYDLIIDGNMTKYDRTLWLKEAFTYNNDFEDESMFTGYSKLLWLKDAILHRSSLIEKQAVKAKPGFYSSNLYNWSGAASEHLKEAQDILKHIL
jgi:hypothetical protein